jgi:hypothetical protein
MLFLQSSPSFSASATKVSSVSPKLLIFLMAGTFLYWTVKTYETKAIKKEVTRDKIERSDILKICKFRQIIKTKTLFFLKTIRFVVFKIMAPQAVEHCLIPLKDHIKNINDVQPRH